MHSRGTKDFREEFMQAMEKVEAVGRLNSRLTFSQIEAAQLLGISPKLLRRDTKLGKIRRTHHKMYSREELERYVRDGMKKDEFRTKG